MSFHAPDKDRVREGPLGTTAMAGNNGVFRIVSSRGDVLRVIASDGLGWEHVSVSTATRCPTWEEMCEVKGRFWDPEDCVVQFHPPRSKYINCHPFCLHLWRPVAAADWVPLPPVYLVGPA